MTFHRRNEIKLNDGSQSLTRNLCSTVATKRGLDRRKPRFFSNYIQSEMEVACVYGFIHLYRIYGKRVNTFI